jgi:hypothetical protein
MTHLPLPSRVKGIRFVFEHRTVTHDELNEVLDTQLRSATISPSRIAFSTDMSGKIASGSMQRTPRYKTTDTDT